MVVSGRWTSSPILSASPPPGAGSAPSRHAGLTLPRRDLRRAALAEHALAEHLARHVQALDRWPSRGPPGSEPAGQHAYVRVAHLGERRPAELGEPPAAAAQGAGGPGGGGGGR